MEIVKSKLRVLMLEDNPDDVQLTKRQLLRSKYDCLLKVIDKEQQLKEQDFDEFDIVLCDYNVADFDGLKAIRHIKKQSDIPIICISGSISEELGLELITAGAEDFIKKSFIKKLPLVIEKTIQKCELKSHSDENVRKLNETSQMFDTLFDGLDNPAYLKDSELKYLRVNEAFCKLYERSESEIIGRSDDEIEWLYQSEHSTKDDRHILEKGKSSNYEFNYVNEDGNRVWLDVTKNPIRIDGEITGILGQLKNISARKDAISAMKKSQNILQQAEELTLSGSFEYDADRDLVTCSKNLSKMLGLHSNEISLGRLIKLIKIEDRSIFLDGLNSSIKHKKEYRMEHRYMLNQNHQGFFEILFRPDYRDESGNTFYGTIVDITKESKESISRIEHQEESRIEIARELHDNLGQKLNAVSMFLSKAMECDDCGPFIEKSTALLHESIDDLGKLLTNISVKHIEDISLSYALERLTTFLPDSMNLTFSCNLDESKISTFVKRQIFRVVQESLNNAVKYSSAKNITIKLEHEGSILSMSVEDDGSGFEMNGEVLGNGLMNITHRVKKSNGLINIESQKGNGTKVLVKMPVS